MGETGKPEGPGQQSQAAHAETSSRGFKQAPACNMDETGAPCRTVRGPRACFGFNSLSFYVSMIDFTLRGVLARWSFLFVVLGLYHGSASLPSFPLSLSPSFPRCFTFLPPSSLQTGTTNQALTFTAVFHITAEPLAVLRRKRTNRGSIYDCM